MEVLVISTVALLASLLTFFSGFGLGTLLLPAFALFFPLPHAVALTAVVHFCNNIFKSGLVFKNVEWKIVWSFGLFSIPAAIIGALILKYSGDSKDVFSYSLFQKHFIVTFQGILVGFIMIFFAVYEYFPFLESRIKPGKNLWLGGLISGFFGGLTGHQGALRSAWLVRIISDKKVYIATGTIIACLVDVSRLGVYWGQVKELNFSTQWQYLIFPVIFAFLGAYLGNVWLKKTTLKSVRLLICILLIFFGLMTVFGMIN